MPGSRWSIRSVGWLRVRYHRVGECCMVSQEIGAALRDLALACMVRVQHQLRGTIATARVGVCALL